MGASHPREAHPYSFGNMPSPQLTIAPSLQSERLLRILAPYSAIRIVTHDNPDPDAIAAGWGLHRLFTEHFDRPIEFVAGGAIVRAENRHLVELLNPPLRIVDRLAEDPDTATVLVDCGLGTSNHLAPRERLRPVADIDHHAIARTPADIAFADIRPSVAATATI